MKSDDEVWVAVRGAYEASSEPLKALAARFGVSVQRIVARARADGWRKRDRDTARPQRKSASPSAEMPTARSQRAVLARLFRAISLKLEHMEARMASGKSRSAQDEERESRALATLINNFEKVTEAVADLDRDENAGRRNRTAADAERMRREIAERLERLGGGGTTEPGPRKP